MGAPLLGWVLKKYGNRRLYDTDESRYVTLDEVAQKVRRGGEPRILDAQSGADLTQATLAQIILEGGGATRLLPVPLLLRLIRLEPDVLADFFGRGIVLALDLYLQARQQAQSAFALNPFSFSYDAARPSDLFSRFTWHQKAHSEVALMAAKQVANHGVIVKVSRTPIAP